MNVNHENSLESLRITSKKNYPKTELQVRLANQREMAKKRKKKPSARMRNRQLRIARLYRREAHKRATQRLLSPSIKLGRNITVW